MLQNLATLLGRKGRTDSAYRTETFGQTRIAREKGEEVLRATSERRNHVQGIRDRLSSMTREEKDELVDRLLARVALFVFDLPASESNHHSGRFGLLDHLLEVAHQTVREAAGPGFRVSPDQSTNHREKPLWVYAGMVAALAHDIGKPLDIDVTAPGSGKCWDPKAEPLRLFCDRHVLRETGPELWHFHVGRGLRGHEKHIGTVLPIVLTPAVLEYLGPRLAAVVEAMTAPGEWKPVGGRAHPAQDIVRILRRIDQSTSQEELAAGKVSVPEPVRPGPLKPTVLRLVPVPEQQSLPFPPVKAEAPRPGASVVAGGLAAPAHRATERVSEDEEEEPLYVPDDYQPESVPDPNNRRGDPTESALRLQAELDPPRFMDTLRRMLLARRLSRNNLCTETYIRPDFVWLIVPRALYRVARFNRLPWDTDTERAMLRSLRGSSLVVPVTARRLKVFVRPRPGGASYQAIRILTQGFLSPDELKRIGVFGYELQALEHQPGAASRS